LKDSKIFSQYATRLSKTVCLKQAVFHHLVIYLWLTMIGSEGPQVNLGGVKTRSDLVKVLDKTTPKTIQEDLK